MGPGGSVFVWTESVYLIRAPMDLHKARERQGIGASLVRTPKEMLVNASGLHVS